MSPNTPSRPYKAASSLVTGQESLYLRFLSEKQVPVHVKLRDGEVVSGWIEYYDDSMIRLTRDGKPNLFIYKQQIRTISELVRKEEGRRRVSLRKEAGELPPLAGEGVSAGQTAAKHAQPGDAGPTAQEQVQEHAR